MIKNPDEIRNEQKRKAKEDQQQLERLQLIIYETFVANPFGKELLEYWTKQYVFPIIGPNNVNLEYITAAGDFIRQIHGMVEEHKSKINKGEM